MLITSHSPGVIYLPEDHYQTHTCTQLCVHAGVCVCAYMYVHESCLRGEAAEGGTAVSALLMGRIKRYCGVGRWLCGRRDEETEDHVCSALYTQWTHRREL